MLTDGNGMALRRGSERGSQLVFQHRGSCSAWGAESGPLGVPGPASVGFGGRDRMGLCGVHSAWPTDRLQTNRMLWD